MKYRFQYCQKIVVLSKDHTKVLLCRRKGEADYDKVFSFIGGKMEATDKSIKEGLHREKNEEVGKECRIRLFPLYSYNLLFRKKDGNPMILPHYLAVHESGKPKINEEYSEYQWVLIEELENFEPKIPSIPKTIKEVLKLKKIAKEEDYVII